MIRGGTLGLPLIVTGISVVLAAVEPTLPRWWMVLMIGGLGANWILAVWGWEEAHEQLQLWRCLFRQLVAIGQEEATHDPAGNHDGARPE